MLRLISQFFLASFVAVALAEEPIRAEANDDGVRILSGDTPILQYQSAIKSFDNRWPRCNYVHPLYGLDGTVITEDFPEDHRHHRGIFWAWHQVLVGEKQLGDAWVCKDFVWDVRETSVVRERTAASILTTVLWKSPAHVGNDGKMIPVVREMTKITVHRRKEHFRSIDFRISLLALVDDVRIGGSDDVKGYGGFSPRIKLNTQQRFLSDNGEVQPTKMAVTAGNWLNVSSSSSGIAILASSSNPQPNDQWILRKSRSMQNAAYPGRNPIVLPTKKPLVLRYRLVIHDGSITTDELSRLQQQFSEE